jgi:hypothetical protein
MRRIPFLPALLVVLAVLTPACAISRWLSPSPSPDDTITYEVAPGPNVTGSYTVIMATPTTTTTAVLTATTPFVSGPIAGYSQFTDTKPSVTVIGYGCFDVYVLANAAKAADKHGCGQPVTVTAK